MNTANLIKVVNPDVANKLVALGFSYILEKLNNQDVYVFTPSQKLSSYLNENFSKNDFILSNKLHF